MMGFVTAVSNRYQRLLVGLATAALLAGVAVWGGVPAPEMRLAFYAGVAVLAVVLFAFGWAGWHLLVAPLPAGQAAPSLAMPPVPFRRLLAALIAVASVAVFVGGVWDEAWHRTYGIPFGEDLFWRPHLLIYGCVLTTCGLAFVALLSLLRREERTLRQRFRANPVFGLLVLVGAFMLLALPVDPLWHIIYGDDISGWSLPHILMIVSFGLVMLLAAAVHLSTVRERPWRTPRQLAREDGLPLLMLAMLLNITMQGLTTDWDAPGTAVLRRPEWLLPAVIAAMGAGVGIVSLRALRLIGAATLVGLIALASRWLLLLLLGEPGMGARGWLAALPVLLALDLAYAAGRQLPPGWLTGAAAAVAGMALAGFPAASLLYEYPAIGLDNLAGMTLAVAVAALGAVYVGQAVGDYLAAGNKQLDVHPGAPPWLRLLAPAVFTGALLLIIWLIVTAGPPV